MSISDHLGVVLSDWEFRMLYDVLKGVPLLAAKPRSNPTGISSPAWRDTSTSIQEYSPTS
ncbi:hypothetical protein PM082_015279 [Marasmius tenuissimus]|nr:hypothetical protein PM082_015279 [Marasmius tenuissimus]